MLKKIQKVVKKSCRKIQILEGIEIGVSVRRREERTKEGKKEKGEERNYWRNYLLKSTS